MFLLDPVAAVHSVGRVPARISHACARLVVGYICGVSAAVCGAPAVGVAAAAFRGLSLPPSSRIVSVFGALRSPGQDAVAAGCSLVIMNGVCVCDLSAPRGADADSLAGMA